MGRASRRGCRRRIAQNCSPSISASFWLQTMMSGWKPWLSVARPARMRAAWMPEVMTRIRATPASRRARLSRAARASLSLSRRTPGRLLFRLVMGSSLHTRKATAPHRPPWPLPYTYSIAAFVVRQVPDPAFSPPVLAGLRLRKFVYGFLPRNADKPALLAANEHFKRYMLYLAKGSIRAWRPVKGSPTSAMILMRLL